MQMVLDYFVNGNTCKMTAYHAKGLFQMVCSRNRFGKLTIDDVYGIYNALAIVYRYAFNGYKLPTKDKSTIYKQPTTK